MGRRVNYEVTCGKQLMLLLFSNSSHATEVPEERFKELAAMHGSQVSDLGAALLGQKYSTQSGNHREGDRMFWLDGEPGDREVVIRIDTSRGNVIEVVDCAEEQEKVTCLARKVSANAEIDLDEMVHEAYSKLASEVNNQGAEGQIAALLELGYTASDIG